MITCLCRNSLALFPFWKYMPEKFALSLSFTNPRMQRTWVLPGLSKRTPHGGIYHVVKKTKDKIQNWLKPVLFWVSPFSPFTWRHFSSWTLTKRTKSFLRGINIYSVKRALISQRSSFTYGLLHISFIMRLYTSAKKRFEIPTRPTKN